MEPGPVGATENAILAAFYATGKTTINNCAIEPEVIDLINFLNKLGGKILVKGRKISIHGTKKIKKKITHSVIFDRIELGTYLIAAALVGKKIHIKNIEPKLIYKELNILRKMGVKLLIKKRSIVVLKIVEEKSNKNDCKIMEPLWEVNPQDPRS